MDVDYSQRVNEMDHALESIAQHASIVGAVMLLVVLAVLVWAFFSWWKKGFLFFLGRFLFAFSLLMAYIGLSFLVEGPHWVKGMVLLFLSLLGFLGSFFMNKRLGDSSEKGTV